MSDKIALVFPGQGSQSVGMGREFFEESEKARSMFEAANLVLGYSLSDLCFNGPEEELRKTLHAQPALYVCGAIAYELGKEREITGDFTAGHSLGEYTALYAAEAFDFETGLRLVKARAEAMNGCAQRHPGTMAAIMGLEAKGVVELCTRAQAKGIVCPANFNAPDQIVISGDAEGVNEACRLAKEAGAKRAIPLAVSGAFHSPLMAEAEQALRAELVKADIQSPKKVFVNNVDAGCLTDPAAIRESLARQLTGAVRWVETLEKLRGAGASKFIEVGPGKVLQGLVRRFDKNLNVTGFSNMQELGGI